MSQPDVRPSAPQRGEAAAPTGGAAQDARNGAEGESAHADELPVLVLSGPSGSGKTTIVNRLVADAPVKLVKAISATTRPQRQHEHDGVDYYFLSTEDFEAKRDRGEFVEWAEVFRSGHLYGTLRSELERAASLGGWAFLEIDVQGALEVMRQYPHAVTIFLQAPSQDAYEQRLRSRGTETEEVIQRRLQTARDELELAIRYRYRVVNDDLDRAVEEIRSILASEEAKRHAG